MTFSDHFQTDGIGIGPQPWMQLRPVANVTQLAVAKQYAPTDGIAKNDLLQAVQVSWINDTPIRQWVYGMVTTAGGRVALQATSRGYLSQSHGARIDAAATVIDPATFQLTEASRFGVGSNIGVGGMLATGTGFCVAEMNENSNTEYLTPAHVGWYLVEPGQKFTGRVEVRFISDNWEANTVDGGSTGTESAVLAGDLDLTLYAVPTVADPPPRALPYIVGGSANTKVDQNIDYGIGDVTLSPAVPGSLQVGDILVAVIVNNIGSIAEIGPLQAGWSQAAVRDGGYLDVHLKIFMRTITDLSAVPASYDFSNGFLAEGLAMMFAVRNTVNFDGSDGGSGWFVSSDLTRWQLGVGAGSQIAPSINRGGQLLIAFSYLTNEPALAPLHQTVPEGMTELKQTAGTVSTLAVASLNNPPTPTDARKFVPDHIPAFYAGHSITVALLVPGIATL